MQEDLLYTHRFLPDDSKPQPNQKQLRESFRKFYEDKFGKPLLRDAGTVKKAPSNNLLSNRLVSNKDTLTLQAQRTTTAPQIEGQDKAAGADAGASSGSGDDPPVLHGMSLRTAIIAIDSGDRDKSLYPSQNNFRIYFGENFINVKRVCLVSTEFPNTEQLIKSQPASKKNNKLYWVNGPDEPDKGIIYSITITEGNYTALTLANELMAKTNVVQRLIDDSSDVKKYHNFAITVDNVTNTFTIRQQNSFNLNNPLNVTQGSSIVTVSHDLHNFLPGQIVNLSGSTKVGGIPTDAINASQVVSVDIEKVDKMVRVSTPSLKQTEITYGTSSTPLTGVVNTTKGLRTVTGLGTNFLAQLGAGSVTHIGYADYTVASVVSNFEFTTEETLQESFNKFRLIKNLTGASGLQPAGLNQLQSTNVFVINNRLRNIYLDYTNAKQVKADNDQETTTNDLVLNIYKKIQKTMSIQNLTGSFKMQVLFGSRDPFYFNFSQFEIMENIDSFNVHDITNLNNTLKMIDANNLSTSVSLQTGTFNIFSILSSLLNALPSWQIVFDTVNHYFYFKPPLTGSAVTLTLPFGTAAYLTYSSVSFDFTGSNTAFAYLGFAPGYTYTGTAILAGSAVNSTSSSITLDSQYNAMYVLYNNNIITVTLSQRTYNNVSELANAIQSYLLSHNVSVSIFVNTGLGSASNTGQIVMIPVNRMSIAFKTGSPTAGVTLASALGFDSNFLHTSNCIVSVLKVGPALSAGLAQGQGQQGYLQEGYYSHHLSEVINAVTVSKSRKLTGSALITNGSAVLQGAYDVLYFPLIGTTLRFGNSTTAIAGELSGNVFLNRSAPYGGLPSSANLYITQTGTETNYSLSAMAYSQGITKYLEVALHPGSGTGFAFTDQSGHRTRSPQLQLGVTYVFDLTALPTSARFRLGQVCNGPNNANSAAQNLLDYNVNATGSLTEFYAYRSYYCEGKYLQVNIPSSAVNLNAIYCYDDLDESRITCPTASSLSGRGDLLGQTHYFTMSLAGTISDYINISQAYNSGASTLTTPLIYTETPVLSLSVGHQYILDYTNLSGQLQLSLTADGNHYIGSPISNAQYISYTVPGTQNGIVGTTSSINLNLATANMPFPPRLYYFLADQAGCGGNGYIDIVQDPNMGVLEIVNPSRTYFRPLLFGNIVATLSGDSRLVALGTVLAYAPNHGLTAYTQNSRLQITDMNTAVSTAVAFQAGYNVTPDNNRFVIHDVSGNVEYDIVLSIGVQTFYDLQADVEAKINDALGLSSLSNDQHWTVAFDNISSFYTFLIPNGRKYEFRFTDFATDGTDLWNSSAELFGFRQADTVAPNNFAALDHIRSNYPAMITRVSDNTLALPATQLTTFSQSTALVYNERVFDQSRIQVGTLTANIAQGDSSLQLSALPASVVLGALLTLTDGNNSSEMGVITSIDPNTYTIVCANPSRTGFTAATPTQVQLRSNFVLPGGYAEAYSGSRWQKDLVVGDQILLGEDFDQVFTVQSILSDSSIQLDSAANFILPTTDAFGNVIAAPSTTYNLPVYKVTGMSLNQFGNNEKFEFFKTEQDSSKWDYDQKLVDTNLIVQRISPIKLAISETDAILEASLADTSDVYEFLSQKNLDLFYIKNNSKYHFPTKYEATSTVTARGGNPVNVGTGVKFSLLFSNYDTPGDLLGFPHVATSNGNTDFKTVLSNTIPRADQQYDILRSEPGTGNKAGNLRVITTTLTAFEYGDQVFIENHKNSSNTVAVNNDEGYTISLYSNDLSVTESVNGLLTTRGVFYIPLDLSYGGIGGRVYKKTLFRPFALSGDNYAFMLCPTLASVNTTSTRMQQVFAKLILDAPPGAVLFNRFVSSDKIFTDALLPEFDHIDLTIVDPRGQFYEFNNVDYSLSLKIFYYVDAPDNTNISARTGKPSS